MTQETKPERQSVEEIAKEHRKRLEGAYNACELLGKTKEAYFKELESHLKEIVISERSISDKLREENEELKTLLGILHNACELHIKTNEMLMESCEELKKRVDSEYDRGIEDAASKCNSCHDCNNPESGFGNNACCSSDRAKAILKLRRG